MYVTNADCLQYYENVHLKMLKEIIHSYINVANAHYVNIKEILQR